MRRILVAEYEKAALNKVITKKCQHLISSKQEIIINLKN